MKTDRFPFVSTASGVAAELVCGLRDGSIVLDQGSSDMPETKRYEVRVIGPGSFCELLYATDDAADAKARADAEGTDYHWGVAILDTHTATADLGDRIVPIAEAFRD